MAAERDTIFGMEPTQPPASEHEQEKIERLRRAMYSRAVSGKLGERERRELDFDEPMVGEDFIPEERHLSSSNVAPRFIGLARKGLWWLLGLSIVFFIAAAGFFSYYFLFGGGSLSASANNIDIVVNGPPQIQSGEPVELQIVVTNRNSTSLGLAELVITYPQGTRSPTDFATDLQNQRITLGSIEPGGTRQGTVSAVLSGVEGTPSDVKVELEYRLGNSSALFTAVKDYNIVFASSPISIAIEGNKEVTVGQPVELTLTVTSNANAPLRDVLLNAEFPFGFKLASAETDLPSIKPKPTIAQGGRGAFWQLGDLSPGQKRTITIRGALSGERGDERIFKFSAGTRTTPTGGLDTPLADNSFRVVIAKPFLNLAVSVNGNAASDAVVSPGDNVTVSITWENNLDTAIANSVIVARLSGIQLDGSKVHSTDGFYRSSDNTLLWDKTTSGGALANLAPKSHGSVGFSFAMPSSDDLKGIVNPRLTISINAAGNRLSESGVPENLQAVSTRKISLATDLKLTAQGLYYANPFGSVGPMPPKAGSETTYAIVFSVTNTTNKISGASVTAHLPPYVRWVGIYSPSTENLSFNQTDGTVTWNIGEIGAGAGLNGSPPRQAAIAIGFTPSTSQIGQEPVLLQNISLSGTDATTNAPVSRSTKDVTTNVAGDPGFSAANASVVK
jgi:hypothetical protein